MSVYALILGGALVTFFLLLSALGLYESRVIDRILAGYDIDYSKENGLFDQLKKAKAVQKLNVPHARCGKRMEVIFRLTVGAFLATVIAFIVGAVFSL